MISRIRYKKLTDNQLVSYKQFKLQDIKCNIFINMNDLSFSIGDGGEKILATGQARTKHLLKIKIKSTLKQLGFNFKNERRILAVKAAIIALLLFLPSCIGV